MWRFCLTKCTAALLYYKICSIIVRGLFTHPDYVYMWLDAFKLNLYILTALYAKVQNLKAN